MSQLPHELSVSGGQTEIPGLVVYNICHGVLFVALPIDT